MSDRNFRDVLWVLLVIVCVTVVICITIDPSIISVRSPGSFEYIRKGERYLAKGKREEAVREYEKAYRSSPGSDAIRAHCVWLYTDYARFLADSGKHAQAIHYFSKAVALKKNHVTMSNLAIGYARTALAAVERGELQKAVSLFSGARDAAAASDRVSENLAIYLYNAGVAAYNAQNDERALLFLGESLLVGESARALEVTGDSYRRKGDLGNAAFYWKRALEIDPRSVALQEKIVQLDKEAAFAQRSEQSRSGHFELHYDGQFPIDRALVSRSLEKAYEGVGAMLRAFPEGRTAVYLYSERDFRNIFKLSNDVQAFYDGAIRIPLPGSLSSADNGSAAEALSGESLSRYIAHEYAHAAVSASMKGACPVWLNEGLAVSAQYGDGGDDAAAWAILGAFEGLSSMTIDLIDAAFRASTSDGRARGDGLGLYYALAYSVVDYVRSAFGDEALRGILQRVKDGQHFSNALDDQLLISEKDFEQRWRKYVDQQRAAYITKGAGHG